MTISKAPRVPVLENAFELNLPKLIRAAEASKAAQLVLDDGTARTVVVLTSTRLAAFLGGQTWLVDIVAVPCLKGRCKHLLKCPRAHEGNFQSLYFRDDELACRRCHGLRYRSNLAPSAASRARIARLKLLKSMGASPVQLVPDRQPFKWRKRHHRLSARVAQLTGLHYQAVRVWLDRKRDRDKRCCAPS